MDNNNNNDDLFVSYEIFGGIKIKIPYWPILKFAYKVYGGEKINLLSPAYTTCHLNEDIMKYINRNDPKVDEFLKEIPEALKKDIDFIEELARYIENRNSDVTKILFEVFDKLSKFSTDQAYSLVRFTFVGEGDDDIVNCGLDQNPENFIYLCYKLAQRDIPDCFVDKIYNALTIDQDAYAHRDANNENEIYYNLLSLIKRGNKNKVKENIIKVFGNANKSAIEFEDEDFNFDKLNLHETDFIIKETDGCKYLNLVSDSNEKSKAAEKICDAIIKNLDNLAHSENQKKKICCGADEIYIEDVISDFDSEFCKKHNSFGYNNSNQIENLIKENLLFNLKIFLATRLNELNKSQFDINPKVINVNEENTAVYFFLSICYSILLPVYEAGSKELMDKLLTNLEQVCKDFSTKSLDSSYLNIDSDGYSYYEAFVKKIVGRSVEKKELDGIRENQENMSKVLEETNVVSEIAAVQIKRELSKDKIPIVRVSNDQLLVSDLFFMCGNWIEYFNNTFDEIEKKYSYKYKFYSTGYDEYKTQIENFISDLLSKDVRLINFFGGEVKLFFVYKLLDLKKGQYCDLEDIELDNDFFISLGKIPDNKIKQDICLKAVQVHIDDAKFDGSYFLIKTLMSNNDFNKNFKRLFKTVCDMEPICNSQSNKIDFLKYDIADFIDSDQDTFYFSHLNPYLLIDKYDYLNGDSKKFQFEGNSLIFWDYLEDNKYEILSVPKLLIGLARYLILIPENLKSQAEEKIKKLISDDQEIKKFNCEFGEFSKNISQYGELLSGISDMKFNDLGEYICCMVYGMDSEAFFCYFEEISNKAHNLEDVCETERKPIKFCYRILKIIEQYMYDLSKSDECFERNRKNIEEFIGLNYKFTAYFSPEIVFRLIENESVQKYLSLLDAEKNKGQIKYIIDEAKKIKNELARNKVSNVLWDCNNAFKKGLEETFKKSKAIVPFEKSISEKFYQALDSQNNNKSVNGIFDILKCCGENFKENTEIVPFKKSISEQLHHALRNNKIPETEKNNEHKNLE